MPSLGASSEMNIIFTAENATGPALAAVAKDIEAVEQKAGSLGKTVGTMGNSLKDMGAKLTMGVTLPIIGVGAAALKMGTDFQSSMEMVHTQAGASQEEVDKLTKSVLELAKHSAQGPKELADGLYHIESLGLRGADAMNALSTASQMAALGNANLEETTSALGAALVTGIRGTEDLSRAAGTLDATIGNGNMRMGELVAALSSGILPAAKNFGLSLTDVGAALATLTDNGMRADEAATRLRMTFSLMAAGSPKSIRALAEIGIGSDELAKKMRSGGLVSAIEDLRTKLEHSGKTATEQARILSDAFGGGRSSAAIMTLVEQSDRLKQKFTLIGQQSGEFAEKFGKTQETAAYQFHAAWAKIQADLIEIGIKVLPIAMKAFSAIADTVTHVVDWFNKLSPAQQKMTAGFVILATVVGPILGILGTLFTIISAIVDIGIATALVIGGIVLAVVALGAVAVVVVTHWTQITKFFETTASSIGKFFVNLWRGVKDGVEDAAGAISRTWKKITTDINTSINTVVEAVARTIPKIPDIIMYELGRAAGAIWRFGNQTVPGFVTAVVAEIGRLPGQLDQAWTNMVSGASHWFSRLYSDATNTASRTVNETSNWFNALPGRIGNAIANLWNAAGGAFNNFNNQAIRWGEDTVNGIMNFFNSLPGRISAAVGRAIGGLGNQLNRASADFMAGFTGHALPHFATGVENFRGGMAIVGERGPEAVYLPKGSTVQPNSSGGGSGGGSGITNNIYGDIRLDGADAVSEWAKQVLGRDTFLNSKGLTGSSI